MSLYFKVIESPVGKLKLIASDQALVAVLWSNEMSGQKRVRVATSMKSLKHPILLKTEKQLAEYFAGKRKKFDLPLSPEGTVFQKKVWNGLRTIPHGKTFSYKELAAAIGKPKAVRAVGTANKRNPISIIVPCHRVIASDGSLAGFAGGLKNKARLLKQESSKTTA